VLPASAGVVATADAGDEGHGPPVAAPATPSPGGGAPEATVDAAWHANAVLDLFPRGPYAVGFRRVVRFSEFLRRETADGDQPWASVLGVWYPAEPTPGKPSMTFGDHLRFGLSGTEAAWLEPRLRANDERVALRDILGAEGGVTSPEQEKGLAEVLALRSVAVEGAPWASGRFPVVVWHPGADGAVTEGVLFAELAASRGFVVVSAAFPAHDSAGLQMSDFEATDEDVHAALEVLRSEPSADLRRLGVVGHSLGAQRALVLGARHLFPRVIVSLDTTWDYESHATWPLAVPAYMEVKESAGSFRAPLLAFAGEGASFTLLRSLAAAPRWLVTTRDMEHDDYTYHGALAALRSEGRASPRLRGLRAVYLLTLGFLRAELQGDETAAASLARGGDEMLRAFGAEDAGLTATRLPASEAGPSAAALLARALERGGDAAVAMCTAPPLPPAKKSRCEVRPLLEAADALTDERQAARAVPLSAHAVEIAPELEGAFFSHTQVLVAAGRAVDARAALELMRKRFPPGDRAKLKKRTDAASQRAYIHALLFFSLARKVEQLEKTAR
jgi:hypothetical protein